jgi:hypothetical protein
LFAPPGGYDVENPFSTMVVPEYDESRYLAGYVAPPVPIARNAWYVDALRGLLSGAIRGGELLAQTAGVPRVGGAPAVRVSAFAPPAPSTTPTATITTLPATPTPLANQSFLPGPLPVTRAWWTPGPGGSYPTPAQVMAQQQAAQRQVVAGGGGGGGGTGGGMVANMAAENPPEGISGRWWNEFRAQHGGQNPSQAYGQHGEGLAEALYDKAWSEGFARAEGRPPTDEEWTAHYYATRGGPRMSEEQRQLRRALRRARGGYVPPTSTTPEQEQRPPTFVPPYVVWR